MYIFVDIYVYVCWYVLLHVYLFLWLFQNQIQIVNGDGAVHRK